MKVNYFKTAVLSSLLVLAALAVILLPAYAGAPEPKLQGVYKAVTIDRPEPKLQPYAGDPVVIDRPEPNLVKLDGVAYEFNWPKEDLITKAKLYEDCGAAVAMGSSESFSFEEAFMNAVDALPQDTTPVYPDKMTEVKVIDIGATWGGITGVARMYVRVYRLPDQACISAKEQQEPQPGPNIIRRRRGELKRLPPR
jgi:hypothetical protein